MLSVIPKNEVDQFELTLADKRNISHDTIWVSFAFPDKSWCLGLAVGGHLCVHSISEEPNLQATRKYTPVSPMNQTGTVDFVIKVYQPCPEFKNGGKFS